MEETNQPLPPVRVLQKFYGRLFKAIHSPELLAGFMYSEELIAREVVNDLPSMTSSEAKTKLLSACSATLEGSNRQENTIERMCFAMEETGEPVLKEVAAEMRALCRGGFLLCACVCVCECVHTLVRPL